VHYTAIALWLHPTSVTGDRFLARFSLYLEAALTSKPCTMSAKKRAITSLHRDSFSAKVSGFCPLLASVNAYLFYQRPVSGQIKRYITINS
jgi:hypothetical protein